MSTRTRGAARLAPLVLFVFVAPACSGPADAPGRLRAPPSASRSSGGASKAAPKPPPSDDGAPSAPPAPSGAPAEAGPTLLSVTPDAVTVGAAPNGVDLTLTGSRFTAGASVDLAGTELAANVTSPTELTVHVPPAALAGAGVLRVAVLAPSRLQSNALTFTVANPKAVTIASLSPAFAVLGDASPVALKVTGTGFLPASIVSFNGAALPTTFTSATELSTTIPGSALIDAGRVGVTVANGGGVVSLPTPFEVRNPAPSATSIAPASIDTGTAPVVVTVTGRGFTRSSSVVASGAPLATTFVSATELRATVPASKLASAATLSLVVTTPAPGGGSSTALPLEVRAAASGGDDAASCLYLCDDYGYAPGECYADWYCIPDGTYAGCLGQTTCPSP